MEELSKKIKDIDNPFIIGNRDKINNLLENNVTWKTNNTGMIKIEDKEVTIFAYDNYDNVYIINNTYVHIRDMSSVSNSNEIDETYNFSAVFIDLDK